MSDDHSPELQRALAAVRQFLEAWDAEDEHEREDLSEELWAGVRALRRIAEDVR